jgi:hypothetical protein
VMGLFCIFWKFDIPGCRSRISTNQHTRRPGAGAGAWGQTTGCSQAGRLDAQLAAVVSCCQVTPPLTNTPQKMGLFFCGNLIPTSGCLDAKKISRVPTAWSWLGRGLGRDRQPDSTKLLRTCFFGGALSSRLFSFVGTRRGRGRNTRTTGGRSPPERTRSRLPASCAHGVRRIPVKVEFHVVRSTGDLLWARAMGIDEQPGRASQKGPFGMRRAPRPARLAIPRSAETGMPPPSVLSSKTHPCKSGVSWPGWQGDLTYSPRNKVSTTGVHKSEKKEVGGQPAVEARARARDGCRSRWGALAEQGEAGSGLGRRPLPCQCGSGATAPVWVSNQQARRRRIRTSTDSDDHLVY